MDIKEIIKKINEIINNPSPFDGNIYQFKYNKNIKTEKDLEKIKTNPVIVIHGFENINKYNHLFNELYKKIIIDNKMSLKFFQENVQQLIFDNEFNENKIKEFVKQSCECSYYIARKFYGIKINENKKILGNSVFVKSSFFKQYVNDNWKVKNNYPNSLILRSINERQENDNSVYYVRQIKTIDSINANLIMNADSEKMKSLFILLTLNTDNFNIDFKSFSSYPIINEGFCVETKDFFASSKIYRKDSVLDFSKIFNNEKDVFKNQLIKIFTKDEPTIFEERIIRSVSYIAKSFSEDDIDICILEVVASFENLLANSNSEKGITACLSEAFAFINSKKLEERIKLEQKFRILYKMRSNRTHGFNKKLKEEITRVEMFNMYLGTLFNLLTKPEFKCLLEDKVELDNLITKLKFS